MMRMEFQIVQSALNEYQLRLRVVDMYSSHSCYFGTYSTKQAAREFMNQLVSSSLASSTQKND